MFRNLRLIGLVAMALATASVLANESAAQDLTIENAWSRATAPNQPAGGAFLTIHNNTNAADRLIAASSPLADTVNLHRTINDDGIMRMRPADVIEIPALGEVTLEPGGLHIMMIGLSEPLREGETVPLTLTFEQAGDVTVEALIHAAGTTSAHDDASHDHPAAKN